MDPVEALIWLLLAGLASGFASGLFGIGGGLTLVPATLLLLDLDVREAVALSLLAMCVATPAGLWPHARAGNVDVRKGLLLGVGGLAGVLLGAYVDPYVPDRLLIFAFAGFLIWGAHRLVYGSRPLLRITGIPALLATGLMAGFVAKLLGIGGGILMVPALVITGGTMHVAVATSLLAVVTNAIASSVLNLFRLPPGLWIQAALPTGLAMAVGAFLGSRTGLRSRHHVLRRAFAVLMLLVALLMVHRGLA